MVRGQHPKLQDLQEVAGIDVIERLDHGGPDSELYRARLQRRVVALKVFQDGVMIDVELLNRFKTNRKHALRHPNLLPVLQAGRTSTGEFFSCTPLLEGDSLREVLSDLCRGSTQNPSLTFLSPTNTKQGRTRRTIELFAAVAEGLAVAHKAGVAHNRLHPGNLVFSPAGRLVITDFGRIDRRPTGGVTSYVAPEERSTYVIRTAWRPQRDDTKKTFCGDVFALGEMLREALVCSPPPSRSVDKDLGSARSATSDPPVTSNGSSSKRTAVYLPQDIVHCIEKATAATPQARYQNAAEFAVELRRCLRYEPPQVVATNGNGNVTSSDRHPDATPTAIRTTMPSTVKRPPVFGSRWTVAALALLLVALIGCVVWMGGEIARQQRAQDFALGVRAHIDGGRFEDALEATGGAAAHGVSTTHAASLTKLVRTSALSEALIVAVDSMTADRYDDAAVAVEAALAITSSDDDLESIVDHLCEIDTAQSEQLMASLHSTSTSEQLGALWALKYEITSGERRERDALLALPLLHHPVPAHRRLAVEAVALTGDSAPLLERLGIGAKRPTVELSEQLFATLHATLSRLDDPMARDLFCAWGLDAHEELADAGPDASVRLEPNLLILFSKPSQYDYNAAWFRWLAKHDADQLIRLAKARVERPECDPSDVDVLLKCLVQLDRVDASAFVAGLARRLPYRVGNAAVRALGEARECGILMQIAIDDGPLPLRQQALEATLSEMSSAHVPQLRTLALTSPHRTLRQTALRGLIASGDPRARSIIPMCMADGALRDLAIQWFASLPPESCSREALRLLRHAHPRARESARAMLEKTNNGWLLLPLSGLLLDPKIRIRTPVWPLTKLQARRLWERHHARLPGVAAILSASGWPSAGFAVLRTWAATKALR